MASRVGIITDPSSMLHDTGLGHPERVERLQILWPLFAGLDAGRFEWAESAAPATEDQLREAHTAGHVERVRETCASGPAHLDGDTPVVPASWDAALIAAGAAVAACRRVAAGELRRAYCAMRPPGHHAEPGRAMGFCLFNNAAVAARALQEEGLAARVAIVDFDVHHGNGTQAVFWEDPEVLYASCHQWPLYPGTGAAEEVGAGLGRGTTLNRPLPPGAGDEAALDWAEGGLDLALRRFKPDFMILSAGFDAHVADAISQLRFSTEGYGRLTAILAAQADDLCGGRLVSVLEGGYELAALHESTAAHLEALAAG